MSAGHFRRKGAAPGARFGADFRRVPAFGGPRYYSGFDPTFPVPEALSDS